MGDWMKTLKPGDLVGVVDETYAAVRRVERITPGGMVVVAPTATSGPGAKPTTFTAYGRERGRGSSWRVAHLVPVEEAREAMAEIKATRERNELLRRIYGVGWREESTETLRRVVAALDGKDGE